MFSRCLEFILYLFFDDVQRAAEVNGRAGDDRPGGGIGLVTIS
jgi:hypothetical protein